MTGRILGSLGIVVDMVSRDEAARFIGGNVYDQHEAGVTAAFSTEAIRLENELSITRGSRAVWRATAIIATLMLGAMTIRCWHQGDIIERFEKVTAQAIAEASRPIVSTTVYPQVNTDLQGVINISPTPVVNLTEVDFAEPLPSEGCAH